MRRCARSAHTLLRRSAAYSPHLPADAVDLLSKDDDYAVRLLLCDPDPQKRWLVGLDPEAPVDAVVRLLADPDDRVRAMAAEHPALPVDLILRSSGNPELSTHALGNPSLPTQVMHQYLDDAGIPR
ncbi:HEAT repeat domain-containing protein [Streptomyces sp. Ag109_G2-15]|uniref:HEAT repeat domain-containing protein n=1 Tax=Streptomyces sp. Ag109_G2-15 TaxID=1938850 RepID=UPI00211C2E13|nr:HEAT repeat domain-containing protein [Streptomyces sp. Ag109_G2-15]